MKSNWVRWGPIG